MKRFAFSLLLLAGLPVSATDPALWPEEQRAFLQDGPALLMSAGDRIALERQDDVARASSLESFLGAQTSSGTESNELREAVRRRMALVASELLSPLDDRARLLFLHGRPFERRLVECREVFKSLEIWRYGDSEGEVAALLYRLNGATAYRLWLPSQGKRVLYTAEMIYLLEQWHDLGKSKRKRWDQKICPVVREIDDLTGIRGLGLALHRTPPGDRLRALLEPPRDLALWVSVAATTELPETPIELSVEGPEIRYLSEKGQRIQTQMLLRLADPSSLGTSDKAAKRGRISVQGVVEREGRFFDRFRLLFEPEIDDNALPLAVDRLLRGGQSYVVRLLVRDEISGRESRRVKGFRVPRHLPGSHRAAEGALTPILGREIARERVQGIDRIRLTPPESPVILGLWRARALVAGPRIRKVVFLLDGTPQMTRNSPPFSTELRLPTIPREIMVRAEGYDLDGALVAADEIVLNRPSGEFSVQILAPARGGVAPGRHTAKAEVVLPEGAQLREVVFRLAGEVAERRTRPPWQAEIQVPDSSEVLFLEVRAELVDGGIAEDVRFLRLPYDMEEVDVGLVELLTTVSDRSGTPVTGLEKRDFSIHSQGLLQEIVRFEPVRDRPITIGVVLDTSTSMSAVLGQAHDAAAGFLERLVKVQDSCFAVAFADRPSLVMARTHDVAAVDAALDNLLAYGHTSLHDALVFSLYHFRGVEGRRALVVLTDGEDTASTVSFENALAYAEDSGVLIYAIALDLSKKKKEARRHLTELTEATGGRAFFVQSVAELGPIYDRIAHEIRSQYLLAYTPRPPGAIQAPVVEVAGRGLTTRTVRSSVP